MSKNFICKGCGETFEKNMESSTPNYCYICNEFYMKQKIAQLEHRLSNCIEPKFKIGQEVWLVLCDGVKKDVVENNYHLYSLEKSRLGLYESCLYATEEEAKAKEYLKK